MTLAEFFDRLGPFADLFVICVFFAVAAIVAGIGEQCMRMRHHRRQPR